VPFQKGRAWNEEDGVGASDFVTGAETMSEAPNFFSVGGLPQGTFAATGKLAVFGDFARVGIKGIAMQGILFQSEFDGTGGIYGIAMQRVLF
jgi:hypothetical protein